MIQANELRIGNMILADGEKTPVTVLSIYDDGHIGTTAYFDGMKGCADTTIEKGSPIPLTPEVLKKCSFDCENFKLTEHNGHYYFEVIRCRAVTLEYLHQLQNLYFILVGKELKVNL